jgi:GntR family transcriptional regulator of vanillate catabolism
MNAVDKRPARPARGGDSIPQTDRVALDLREMLLRGRFRPGERLAELTLVPLLNASRTPVRLALQRLSHEGLLEAVPTGGFRVRSFTLSDIWDAIELRGVLEGTAARLAAERLAHPDELEELRASCAALEHVRPMTREAFLVYLEVNVRFHRELWRLAKSRTLLRLIEFAVALPFAAPGALLFGHSEQGERAAAAAIGAEHHRWILEAIQNREGTRAESLAREHSRLARMNLQSALQDGEVLSRIPGSSLITLPKGH